MKSWPVSLTGTTLHFDRSGRRVIAVEPDEIKVIHVASSETTRLPYAGARAVAGFDDQLWIATRDDRLVRVGATGRLLGEPARLPFAVHAVLAPAPCGPAAAVWSATPPAVLRDSRDAASDDLGELTCTEIPEVDAVIPITGRRFVVARGSRLTLPSGLTVVLAPNTAVLGGCVTSDGKALTLLVAHSGGRQLVVVSLGMGQVTQRRTVGPRETVAIARTIAAIQREPRVLSVVDLGTHRELGAVTLDHDITAFAIDPTGRSIAIRSNDGEIELHRIDPLLQRHVLVPPPKPAVAVQPPGAGVDPGTAEREIAARPTRREATGDGARDLRQARFDPGTLTTLTTTADAPIAPFVIAREEPAMEEVVTVCHFSAPTISATDWLCGSGDYLEGST